jgi:hypothetical protein
LNLDARELSRIKLPPNDRFRHNRHADSRLDRALDRLVQRELHFNPGQRSNTLKRGFDQRPRARSRLTDDEWMRVKRCERDSPPLGPGCAIGTTSTIGSWTQGRAMSPASRAMT